MQPNDSEPLTGWVRAFYARASDHRWRWVYRGSVVTSPTLIMPWGASHQPPQQFLMLVRQFPHRLNDVIEVPIWP